MKTLLATLMTTLALSTAAQAAVINYTFDATLNTSGTVEVGNNETRLFHGCWDTTSTSNRDTYNVVFKNLRLSDVVIEQGEDHIAGVPVITVHAKGRNASFRTVFLSADGAYCQQGAASLTFTDRTIRSLADLRITKLNGTTAANTLNGTSSHEYLNGLAGNDRLNAGSGHDILNGGAGNDDLYGGNGDDVYVMDGNFGYDIASDTAGYDVIKFSGLSVYDVRFTRSGSDLVLERVGTTDKVLVKGYYTSAGLIEQIKFKATSTSGAEALTQAGVAERVACQSPGCFVPPSP